MVAAWRKATRPNSETESVKEMGLLLEMQIQPPSEVGLSLWMASQAKCKKHWESIRDCFMTFSQQSQTCGTLLTHQQRGRGSMSKMLSNGNLDKSMPMMCPKWHQRKGCWPQPVTSFPSSFSWLCLSRSTYPRWARSSTPPNCVASGGLAFVPDAGERGRIFRLGRVEGS